MMATCPSEKTPLSSRLAWIAHHENDGKYYVMHEALYSATKRVVTGPGVRGKYASRRHILVDESVLRIEMWHENHIEIISEEDEHAEEKAFREAFKELDNEFMKVLTK